MSNEEKILNAYNKIMDQVAEAIHTADIALQPTMEEIIDNASKIAHKAQHISLKEANELSTYLKRDLSDVLHNMQQHGKELNEWLSFDYALVEDKFIDIVSRAADKTWITLNNFEESKRVAIIYKTGEITSPGILDCTHCKQSMQFKKSVHIPPCPKCHKTEFTRKPL